MCGLASGSETILSLLWSCFWQSYVFSWSVNVNSPSKAVFNSVIPHSQFSGAERSRPKWTRNISFTLASTAMSDAPSLSVWRCRQPGRRTPIQSYRISKQTHRFIGLSQLPYRRFRYHQWKLLNPWNCRVDMPTSRDTARHALRAQLIFRNRP